MSDVALPVGTREHPRATVAKAWDHDGRPCRIVRIQRVAEADYERMEADLRERGLGGASMRPYHYCGYVRSSLAGGYDDPQFREIDVHGGLTYGVDEAGWLGFDAAHARDQPGWMGSDGERSVDVGGYLTEQVESLAEQVAMIEIERETDDERE